MADTTDPDLIAQYSAAMLGLQFTGLSVAQHRVAIGELIRRHQAVTLLDYGCGKAAAYAAPHKLHKRWGVPQPTLYDPSWPLFQDKPDGTFDGVICSDVLEHVGIEHVDAVIAELFGYADKFVFASVCCRKAKKKFSDGTNMHVTIRPYAWWQKKFEQFATGRAEYVLIQTP